MASVIIAPCFGLAGGIVGKLKGTSFILWFLISGAVPFFGLLAAIADRFERDELRRACPSCGAALDFPEPALAPESWQRGTLAGEKRGDLRPYVPVRERR